MVDKFLEEEIIRVRREIAMLKAHNAQYEINRLKRLLTRLNEMADEEENQERVDNGQFGVGA